jgi:hypothetical protein
MGHGDSMIVAVERSSENPARPRVATLPGPPPGD